MALAVSTGILHIPFGERPQYGSPYPEGMAVGFLNEADDASGGSHTFTFLADGGFLYRLELLNYTRGEATARVTHCITNHRWAADKVDVISTAFDLNWFLSPSLGGGFSVYNLGGGSAGGQGAVDHFPMIRRVPMGQLGQDKLQTLFHLDMTVNTNGITNELSIVLTYWRKEAMFRPGFLSAFWEASEVPPITRGVV